jgi:hypothetical protein
VYIVPAAPTGLVADGKLGDNFDIHLTWVDNSTGEDGFSIEQEDRDGNIVEYWKPVPVSQPCVISGLGLNNPYTFRVRAKIGAIYSDYSNMDTDIPNTN